MISPWGCTDVVQAPRLANGANMASSEGPHEDLTDLEAAIAALPPDSALRIELERQRATLLAQDDEPVSTDHDEASHPASPAGGLDHIPTDGSEADPLEARVQPDPAATSAEQPAAVATAEPSDNAEQTGPSSRAMLWAALAATIGVGVAVAAWFITGYATVPDVTNDDRGYAAGVLRSAGFEMETISEPDPDVASGQVLGQQPEPGTRLRHGETITVIVAERPTHTLTGSFVLLAETSGTDENCYGTGGYSDVQSGVTVTVRDGSGTTLATGRLGPGDRVGRTMCEFPFEVTDIAQADFYAIEVGRRGELTYSHTEMEGVGWDVGFSLGS